MQLRFVNVGTPREVVWRERSAVTAIYKEPVEGRIALGKLGLDGDQQANLAVHGGVNKAVYCYPLGHYEFWRGEMPGLDLPPGSFGENFTVDDCSEDSVHVGDRFTVGSAEVVVTQPRLPCFKLAMKFQSDDIIKRFFASRRSGFYLGVTREGDVGAGDSFTLVSRDAAGVSISEIIRLYAEKNYSDEDVSAVHRVLEAPLPGNWKADFRERLERIGKDDSDEAA